MSKCDVCLRSEGGVCPSCAPAEIARLRAELEAMKKERDEAQITVESSDYDKAAGILRARLRTTKEMKYIAMGFEFKEENEE
jgi:hypothetical protein